MSSTRYAQDGQRRQHGYASDMAFVEARGVQGGAVAAKASLLLEPKMRSLLYFLASLSCEDGGLHKVARELVEMFPERVTTCTTRREKIEG